MSAFTDSWRRRRALIVKEWRQITRDPSSLAIAFLVPMLLLFLFGYGVSLDTERVRIGVVIERQTPESRGAASALGNARYFRTSFYSGRELAQRALDAGEIAGILIIGQDFARKAYADTGARAQLIVDGVDASTGRIIAGYVESALQTRLSARQDEVASDTPGPVDLKPRIWFNPEVRSRNFLVPGLIAIIMTVIGTLLTALVVAREWERGTMEALLVTPVTTADILIGKIVPYFFLGMGGLAMTVIVALTLFQVPLRGSLLYLVTSSSVFMLAALGLGLFISSATKNQFLAGQVSLIAGYLPAFMLSGFLFDIASMPAAIQYLSHIVSARYFVSILQTTFLVGDVPAVLWPNLLGMAVLAAFFLALSFRLNRKKLG